MLKEELQQIIEYISSKHTLFTGVGFLKEERKVGGFKGITNEYLNYFFIKTDSLDIDKYNFEKDFTEHGVGEFELSYDFEIIFQTKCTIPNFLEVLILDLDNLIGLTLRSASDDTEVIYVNETGQPLKSDGFQLYRLKYNYNERINLQSYVSCLTETCFDADCCK